MKFNLFGLSIGFLMLYLFSACNEPTIIGSDLLEGEQGEIEYTDTLSIALATVTGDSALIFSPLGNNLSNYLFGDFSDPIFGKTNSEIFFRLEGPNAVPDFTSAAAIDSVVLVLPYDSASTYGTFDQPFGIEVFELTQDMEEGEFYYTNTSFETEMTPVASKVFRANLTDSVHVLHPASGKAEERAFAPQLRINMGQVFADKLMNQDSSIYQADSLFNSVFKGLLLKPNMTTGGMLSFDMIDQYATLSIYYRQDTSFRKYDIDFDRVIVSHVRHDYSGSLVENFVGADAADSLLFVQGLQGLNVKIELPDLTTVLQEAIISKAELEFTVAELPGDNLDIYYPATQTWLLKEQGDTSRVLLEDVAFAYTSSRSLAQLKAYFGGQPIFAPNKNQTIYKMNISAYLQEIIRGSTSRDIYLEVFNRTQNITRTVFYGANHPLYPAKLNLYYINSTN